MRRRSILWSLVAVMAVAGLGFDNSMAAAPAYFPAPQTAQQSTVVSDATVTPTYTSTATTMPATPIVRTAAIKGNSLSIPSIGLQASVLEVGVTADNAIDVPSGSQVGHWVGSARPGQTGATFLDGHVDGVFNHLSGVYVGQTVRVNYGGQVYNYRVVHTEVVSLDGIDMTRALSVWDDAAEGLNIMTCAGTYVQSADTYDHRLVVYAVRIS